MAEFQLAAKYGRVDVPDVKASFRRHLSNMGSAARIIDWCEDSLYLLDIMCDLLKDNKDILRDRGMRYFSAQNYNRAARIQSWSKRFHGYFIVYKTFEYCHSPVSHLLTRNAFYRALQSFKRNMINTA